MNAHVWADALRGPYGKELLGDAFAYGVNDETIQFLLEGEARCQSFARFCCYEELEKCESSPNPDATLTASVGKNR